MDAALRDHAARAWPPAEARRVDGWLLRSTPDVPRGRLNSALPLRPDPELGPVLEFYGARGQAPQVQARWLAAWGACEGRDRDDVAAHAHTVLARLPGRVAYALVPPAQAVGLAVCDRKRVGLFCVAVDPARRRGGLGTAIVRALMAWGREHGAREAFLDVEQRNAPALALYARLGFRAAYDYVHRVAP